MGIIRRTDSNQKFELDVSEEMVYFDSINEKVKASATRVFESRVVNNSRILMSTKIVLMSPKVPQEIELYCAENGEKEIIFEVMKDGKKFDVSISVASIKESLLPENLRTNYVHSGEAVVRNQLQSADKLREDALREIESAPKSNRFEILQRKFFPKVFSPEEIAVQEHEELDLLLDPEISFEKKQESSFWSFPLLRFFYWLFWGFLFSDKKEN